MSYLRKKSLRLEVLEILFMLGLAAMVVVAPGLAKADNFTLNILHNNDGESELLADGEFGGVSRYITKINEVRAAIPAGEGVITLSSGDNFLAGAQFSVSLNNGVPFYDTIAMDMIGYDAVCIGNHDLDFGPDVLADFINGYTSPVTYLSANLDMVNEPNLQALVDQGRIAASKVVEVEGRQVGIIGATTQAVNFISSPRNIIVNQVLPAIQAEVASLEGMGVDIIILISHLQSVQLDMELAAELSGVDVMIAGGGDELLASADDLLIPGDEAYVAGDYPLYASDLNGTSIPVVTTSGQYQYLGHLVVTFDEMGNLVSVDDAASGPHRIVSDMYADGVVVDATAADMIDAPLEEALAGLASDIIATSEVDLDGVRSHVRTMETNQGNLIADAMLWTARTNAAAYNVPEADIALQNGGGIRNDEIVPAGPISTLKTFDMVPFPNFITVLPNLPRAQVKAILENAVSRVEFTDGRFAQVAGMRMYYNPENTPMDIDDETGEVLVEGERVIDLVLEDGTMIVADGMVVPGPDLTVATINFLAGGGDEYPFNGAPYVQMGFTYQQSLANYLVDGLSGMVTAAMYPEGGEGRIVTEPGVVSNEIEVEDVVENTTPAAFQLAQNYPNPFNPTTSIKFSLERDMDVRLEIVDLAGRRVATLVNEARTAGEHSVMWNGTDNNGRSVPSGTYLYRVVTDNRIESRLMTLLK